MLPEAEKTLKSDLDEIGQKMMARKEKLLAAASKSA